VMTAENGAEAVDIYKEYFRNIHLVIQDVMLPDLDAHQVYLGFKKINPYVLVMLTSGFNVNKQISTLLNQGCVGFVQKPFQSKSLAIKIRAALNREIPKSVEKNPTIG